MIDKRNPCRARSVVRNTALMSNPHRIASSEYVSGRPGLFDRSTEYHFSMESSSNQKVMLPRFTKDWLYCRQLRMRYLSFFLEGVVWCHVEPKSFCVSNKKFIDSLA